MDYRSFVTERARSGDPGAQRVLDRARNADAQQQEARSSEREPQRVSLAEVRLRSTSFGWRKRRRYQRARAARERLQRVERPPTLDEALAAERRRIQERTADATRFTDAERVRLEQLAKRSARGIR